MTLETYDIVKNMTPYQLEDLHRSLQMRARILYITRMYPIRSMVVMVADYWGKQYRITAVEPSPDGIGIDMWATNGNETALVLPNDIAPAPVSYN